MDWSGKERRRLIFITSRWSLHVDVSVGSLIRRVDIPPLWPTGGPAIIRYNRISSHPLEPGERPRTINHRGEPAKPWSTRPTGRQADDTDLPSIDHARDERIRKLRLGCHPLSRFKGATIISTPQKSYSWFFFGGNHRTDDWLDRG